MLDAQFEQLVGSLSSGGKMKRRNQCAIAGLILSLTIATVAAAQQVAPAASPAAEAGMVWSPECGCKKKGFSKLVVTPLKLPFVSKGKPQKRLFWMMNA